MRTYISDHRVILDLTPQEHAELLKSITPTASCADGDAVAFRAALTGDAPASGMVPADEAVKGWLQGFYDKHEPARASYILSWLGGNACDAHGIEGELMAYLTGRPYAPNDVEQALVSLMAKYFRCLSGTSQTLRKLVRALEDAETASRALAIIQDKVGRSLVPAEAQQQS